MLLLRSELEELGCSTYYGPENVLQGRLAGNMPGESIAFMAHVDTADDVPGNGVKPIVHSPYNSQDIVLGGITISTEENPDLIRYKDGTVVTTDVLVKICVALNCEIGDIVEIVPDENA